jgi:hypothetical protein
MIVLLHILTTNRLGGGNSVTRRGKAEGFAISMWENRCIELITYMNNTKVSRVEASKVHLKTHFNFKIFLIYNVLYVFY